MPQGVYGGDWAIRLTAFLAFAGYVLALARRQGRAGPSGSGWWALGLAALLAHLACAFHFAHGWSHTRALAATAAHTAEVTGIGTGVGMLPGLGVSLAAFLGYGAAKRASKTPEKFGQGTIEGIQATEASNSAVVGSNLIPTIALGIPGNVAAALLIGAFMIHGVVPGPLMMIEHGALVYSIFASMLMANVAHLIIGRIGITIWVKFVLIPKKIILPVVTVFCFLGVYIPSNSMFDVGLLLVFGGIGYFMRKSGFSIVCLVIGFLLGPMLEMALRQTCLLYTSPSPRDGLLSRMPSSA